ncbi:biorientation of chromosomes in cell division protein 1-like 1 isoform X3 [Euwallacea fornicatus]|uniref:biorientation of chromosomes in cell division protein 1-like 1 isoform X3 n=1 Tax=Euwallacea fornicatus TaxID=995702 RepID=UPI00339024E4
MDIFPSSFLPGDPRLIDQIVYELKSQGIFDQFRKECISDVDTKPAYQNLSQWVEGSVMNFLNQLKFASDTNKNQLREQLRKNITESGFLEVGVERIVDQAVNPKITSVFLPKVEDVVYRFLGIQKPEAKESVEESKPKTEDLLPIDLEAVSPESVLGNSINSSIEKKEENVVAAAHKENDNSFNNSELKPDDESPAFEPLHDNEKFLVEEENSVESNVSNISDLILAAAILNSTKNNEIDLSESVETSQGTSQSNIKQFAATPEEDPKMDVCENTMASECSDKLEIAEEKTETAEEKVPVESNFATDSSALSKKCDSKKSHDKHKSSRSDKSKRDDKDKGERSKSDSKSKESRDKTKYSSSSKDKDKRDQSNGKELTQDKDKSSKKESRDRDKNKDDKSTKETKEKLEKVKDRSDKERSSGKDRSKSESEKQKEKSKWDKDRTNDKDKSSSQKSKEKSSRSSRKDDAARDKSRRKEDRKDKDEKSSKDKSSSSRDKDRPSSHKDSFNISKEKIKSNSSSSRDKERSGDKKAPGDSKSRTDKHSNTDKDRSSSAKREKDKVAIDDHYSFKKKISERRSTDRDSNDGSSKMSKSSRFMESFSSNPSKSEGSKSSECFSSESGDSGSNTDNVEKSKHGEHVDNADVCLGSPIKYIKPKFASNIQEAMRIMKIRKQLAKLERQNQLSLSHVPLNQADFNQSSPSTPSGENSEDQLNNLYSSESSVLEATLKRNIHQVDAVEDIPTLRSQVLSMESFQALEARLAQEMSNIDEHMYGEEDESYEYPSIKSNPVKKRKLAEENYNDVEKILPQSLENVDLEENVSPKRTEESDQTKFKGFAIADRNYTIVEKLQAEIDILLQGVNNKIAQLTQLRSQEVEVTTVEKYHVLPENELNIKCVLPGTKHKNGEKLIIKICKIQGESCTFKELNQRKQERKISFDKAIEKDMLANTLNKSVSDETKVKHNGQVVADKVVNNQEREIPNWETDEVPCRFFDKTSTLMSTAHLKILNREIVGLEASIEDESLKIQNNVPKLKKQGTKKKAESSENNNRISCEYKPPIKQKLLSDANANQTNKSNVCNTSLTLIVDVSSHQDFLLPLSPAESVKSGDHKKEKPVMVKPKRDSANKRYSSEDLYKPRPVLSCTSRRRSDRFGDVGKS